MGGNKRQFAKLLQTGIKLIGAYHDKKIKDVQADLGEKLGLSAESIIKFSKGNIPSQSDYVFKLATQIVNNGQANKEWAKQFFIAAGYPSNSHYYKEWLTQLFPETDIKTKLQLGATENTGSVIETQERPSKEQGTNRPNSDWWHLVISKQSLLIGSICFGLAVMMALYLLSNKQAQKLPIFADNFDDAQSSRLNWTMDTAEHALLKDGRLWFDVSQNTNRVWNAEVVEMFMEDNKYFSRIDFTIQLEAIPDQKNGYIGVQTDCDKGWLIARVGDTPPAFFVEYSQSAEEDNDFKGIIVNRLASIDTGKEYNVTIIWNQKEATISLDNHVQDTVPCLPSRFLAVFAGLPLETSVRGFIDNVKVWD